MREWGGRGTVFIMAHIFLRDIDKLWSADTFVSLHTASASMLFIFDTHKKKEKLVLTAEQIKKKFSREGL
jgi:hypothetical protein